MQLFDPDRPQAAPDVPAILFDGSACPIVSFFPNSDGTVRLSIMLAVYDSGSSFNYAWRHKTLDLLEMPKFVADYIADPELTFKTYFDWQPQARHRPNVKPVAKPQIMTSDLQSAMDLL